MKISKFISAATLLVLGESARASDLKMITAKDVVERLDVTSFPSSIGPRKKAGKKLFSDYAFKSVQMNESSAVLAESDRWEFKIRVLSGAGEPPTICIEDTAKNGGSYHAQSALRLTESSQTHLLVANKEKTLNKDCPNFAK